MKKKQNNRCVYKKTDLPLRKRIRRDFCRRLLPSLMGIAAILFGALSVAVKAYGVVELSALECMIIFFILPVVLTLAVSLFIIFRVTEVIRDGYDVVDQAVQRLAMGHYNKNKPQPADNTLSLYDGLNTIEAKLIEKDLRVESIGKKCNQLESEYEGETCRRLGAKVNPELMKTVLTAIQTMAEDGRCEDILEMLDDANEVLNASLEDGTGSRPLAEELSRIKRFLEIYEAVLQRKIGYRMSIMCNIVNYRIIPNLILPVVQILFERANAAENESYEIGVEVNSSFNNLLIIVRDNNGIASEDEFSYVVNDNTASAAADDGPITIGALNRRITSFYGEKYSVKLSANKLGTAVYIYLPPPSGSVRQPIKK